MHLVQGCFRACFLRVALRESAQQAFFNRVVKAVTFVDALYWVNAGKRCTPDIMFFSPR